MGWLKRTVARKAKRNSRFRTWLIALLASLGYLVIPVADSVVTNFTFDNATTYTDGSPMPLSAIEETRLYCDGNIVATITDGSEEFNPDLTPGSYACYATHVANGIESVPSNTVTKVVDQPPPSPPDNLQ